MKISTFFNYLTIVSIGIAIFFSDSLAILLILSGFILYFSLHKLHFKYYWADLMFFFYFLLASFVYIRLSLDVKEYTTIVFFPFIVFIFSKFISVQINKLNVIKLLLIITALYSLLMFFRDIHGNFTFSLSKNIYRTERQVDDTMTENSNFFKNATNMSLWLATSFILSFVLYKHTRKKIYLFVYVFFLMLVLFSNTRSIMGCCIIILVVNFFLLKRNGKSYLLIFGMIILPLLYSFFLNLGLGNQVQIDRITAIFDSKQDYGLDNRLAFWAKAIEYISKDKWGYGHFFLFNKIGRSAHNDYIGQVLGVGLLAAILFFVFIFFYFFKSYNFLKKRPQVTDIFWMEICLYLLITYIVTSMTEQVSVSNKIWMAILFMAIGYSSKVFNQEKNFWRDEFQNDVILKKESLGLKRLSKTKG